MTEDRQGFGKAMLAKIVVGVVTSVVGAAIVYFIFNKDEGYEKRREATVRAWNAYLETKSTASAVFKNLSKEMDGKAIEVRESRLDEKVAIEKAKSSFVRELDLTLKSLEHLKREEGVDKRFFSVVDITIEQIKDMKVVMEAWLDKLKKLASEVETMTEEEVRQQAALAVSQVEKELKEIKERDTIRFDRLHKELCADYKETFPLKK